MKSEPWSVIPYKDFRIFWERLFQFGLALEFFREACFSYWLKRKCRGLSEDEQIKFLRTGKLNVLAPEVN